jgi:hypothetical protein
MRFEDLSRDDLKALQERLELLGFDPGRVDGIWGPRTARAYEAYLATRPTAPPVIIQPAAAKPWYLSRRIIGAVVAMVAAGAGLAGYSVDAAETTELALQVVTLLGAIVAWWGGIKGKAPIDTGLIAPGIRLPQRVRHLPLSPGADEPAETSRPLGRHFSE